MKIVDVHTHAFPGNLAEKAIRNLAKSTGPYKPFTNGTIGGLLSSMDEAGIHSSFVLSIATKPEQAVPIRIWAKEIASERIIPLGSVHPDSTTWQNDLDGFKANGIKGIKLHAMYQNFAVDEERMFPIYEYVAASKMFIIFHAGNDIAFPGNTLASVDKISNIVKNFPKLKIIAAHFGGWREWPAVYEHLCGKDIFIETSFIHEVDEKLRNNILLNHDQNRFLFGTDSPWSSQKAQVEFIKNLPVIDDDFKEKILCKNVNLLLRF